MWAGLCVGSFITRPQSESEGGLSFVSKCVILYFSMIFFPRFRKIDSVSISLITLLITSNTLFVFSERLNEADPTEPMPITPWTSRLSKLCQPDLDYIGELRRSLSTIFGDGLAAVLIMGFTLPAFIRNQCIRYMFTAPEVQLQSQICMQSDMFSLGMVITAIYNHGRPIMQANNSNTSYQRQLEMASISLYAFVLPTCVLYYPVLSVDSKINWHIELNPAKSIARLRRDILLSKIVKGIWLWKPVIGCICVPA